MEILEIDLKKIKPYKNNPRCNKKAVKYVKESIERFGVKQPLVIDKNNEIVVGHTRYLALKKLGYKKAPCLIASDLTEEEIKSYRIADNKTNEYSSWDYNLLNLEISDMNLNFDFNMKTPLAEEKKEKVFHRNNTIKQYNLEYYDETNIAGKFQMPVIKKTEYIPQSLIGFNYVLSNKDKNTGIHCFVDDYQFERLWREPMTYIGKIREYNCFLSPDFSLYINMPYAMKIWNVYRSRLIGQLYQSMGIEVIPTVSWAEKETFDFCFDGIEKNSVVAISTIGVKKSKEAFKVWKNGMDELIRRLKPKTILCYGGKVDYDYQGIKVIYYDNKVTERLKKL